MGWIHRGYAGVTGCRPRQPSMFGYTSAGTRQSFSETRGAGLNFDSIKLARADHEPAAPWPHTPGDRIGLVAPSDPVEQPPITGSASGGEYPAQARHRWKVWATCHHAGDRPATGGPEVDDIAIPYDNPVGVCHLASLRQGIPAPHIYRRHAANPLAASGFPTGATAADLARHARRQVTARSASATRLGGEY